MSKVRAAAALCWILVVVFLGACAVEIAVVSPLVRLLPPRARERLLSAWKQAIGSGILVPLKLVAGARWSALPVIPHSPGILILMNHQSLLDIPLVVKCVRGGYPFIVARARYLHPKYLLLAHMLRLYRHPVVHPGASTPAQLAALGRFAAGAEHPVVIYPEGTRSRDGGIGPFRRAGLRAILGGRSWQVYLLVADGFWQTARLGEFLTGAHRIRGKFSLLGPFPSPAAGAEGELEDFMDRMRTSMSFEINRLRESAPGDPRPGAALPGDLPTAVG